MGGGGRGIRAVVCGLGLAEGHVERKLWGCGHTAAAAGSEGSDPNGGGGGEEAEEGAEESQ